MCTCICTLLRLDQQMYQYVISSRICPTSYFIITLCRLVIHTINIIVVESVLITIRVRYSRVFDRWFNSICSCFFWLRFFYFHLLLRRWWLIITCISTLTTNAATTTTARHGGYSQAESAEPASGFWFGWMLDSNWFISWSKVDQCIQLWSCSSVVVGRRHCWLHVRYK